MNGGPGASSLLGAFTEMGQLIFTRDSNQTAGAPPRLFRNPSSWTVSANMLYIEAPAGVGYSYCVDPESKCGNNDTSTAKDNHEFLVGFLKLFPEYSKRDLFLTGESCKRRPRRQTPDDPSVAGALSPKSSEHLSAC